MGVGRYLLGVAAALLALVPLAFGVHALCRRWAASLTGPAAVLADLVLGVSIIVFVSEVLGSIGLFNLVPMTLTLGILGVAVWRLTPTARVATSSETPSSDMGGPQPVFRVAATSAVALLAAEWTMRTADSLQRGMEATADTLWYHMPVAARFVQTGWTSRLHYVDGGSLTVFYPANAELFHALGIMFAGTDILSPFVNAVWVAVALLAAWCIGRRFGVAPLTMIGAVVLLATPELVIDDAGSAYNDVIGLAFLLAAVALLLEANIGERRRAPEMRPFAWGPFIGASLAAGVALGTKYTMIPAVGTLTLAVGLLLFTRQPRGRRTRPMLAWVVLLAATGGYWYIRNLFTVGNPVPTLGLGIGPLHLRSVPTPGLERLTTYAFDRHSWTTYFLPGLREAFGPAWWALLPLAVGALVGGVFARTSAVVRAVAVVGGLSALAYLMSPQILGFGAVLSEFVVNVRYVDAALILGLVLLPIVALHFPSARLWLLALFIAVLTATQFAPGLWRNVPGNINGITQGTAPRVWGVLVGIGAVLAGTVLVTYSDRFRSYQRFAMSAVTTTLVLAIVVGYGIERSYVSHRYAQPFLMRSMFVWAQHEHDKRIAIVNFVAQYPLYGKDASNYVQYIAHRAPGGESSPISTCREWRQTLNDGRYDYVIVSNPGFPFGTRLPVPQAQWTRSDPAVQLVTEETDLVNTHVWLFAIHGKLEPYACNK